jgi:hypothetical protein
MLADNLTENNMYALDIIVRVAKRSMDILVNSNPEGDILTAPTNAAELMTLNNNLDAIIENKLRKTFKID